MPNTHKSAAVPFVNQKGEVSMKRVKVERYVAGKKPSYAKEDDDDEDDYTTDEEETDEEKDDKSSDTQATGDDDEDEGSDGDESKPIKYEAGRSRGRPIIKRETSQEDKIDPSDEDEDEDDPRFRRLKQLESKTNATQMINLQTARPIGSKFEDSSKNIVIDDDDDEEEIKQRHLNARKRQIEEPIGPQAVLGDLFDASDPANLVSDLQESNSKRQIDTDDLLKDLKITLRPPKASLKTEEEQEAEQRRLKDMLDRAKDEAIFTEQINRKIEEDIKREKEREALAKGDIGARDMSSVKTDDEDDEIAYEEWKLREITRVLRDKAERAKVKTC